MRIDWFTRVEAGGARIPSFLDSKSVKAFISDDLISALSSPIYYRRKVGAPAFGYEATLLPKICNAILDARKQLIQFLLGMDRIQDCGPKLSATACNVPVGA
jgi:hypothetical protein